MKIKVEKATSPGFFKLDPKNMGLLLEASIILRHKFGDFTLDGSFSGTATISDLISNLQERIFNNREYGLVSKQTIIGLNDKWRQKR